MNIQEFTDKFTDATRNLSKEETVELLRLFQSLSEDIKKILDYNKVKYKPGNRMAFAMLCSFVLSFIGLPIFILSAITFLILFWTNLVKNREIMSALKVNNKLRFPV